ncbi:MAG: PEP-CTERM sorting domain-containing protein [Verrucomicrobiales bacterium]
MKKSLLAVLLLTGLSSAHAANIAFISFHATDAPSAAAAAAGLTSASDIGYTNALTAAGHNVTRYATKDDPTADDAAIYNAADLVIISRAVSSGHYQQETAFWNTAITAPVINMGGYTLRNSRLNFTDGADMPDTTGNVALSIVGAHPIFDGVTLNGAGGVDYAVNVEEPLLATPTQRGISVNANNVVGGTVLATVDGIANGFAIAEWQKGATLNNGDVLGGNRLVFLSGSREASGISSETAGLYDLTSEGNKMFLNAVDYMAVPEPGTALLAGMGCVLMMFRRRRN